MKKVLVITPFFYPHIGGSERYMENLYLFLTKKHPEITVDVLCYNTNQVSQQEKYQGLNIYRIPGWNILPDRFSLPNPVALTKFLFKHKNYDLIHCSTRFFDSSWWAPIYAKLTHTKIVLTDHCADYPTAGNIFIDALVRILENTVVRFSLHFYDAVFAETKATKQFLKKNFGINSVVAYPGLSSIQPHPRRKNKKITVVYVGRLIKSKGVEVLFDIAKENAAANFIFAGAGELEKTLKQRSKSQKNVSVLGAVSKNEVANILEKADIFAYPSWHSEGLPLALLEAGEKGVAVVATDTGAISELISDKTGMLVQSKNTQAFKAALRTLLQNQTLREKLGNNLQKFTQENFSWDAAANLVLKQLK